MQRKMLHGLKKKKCDKQKQEESTLYKPGAFWDILDKIHFVDTYLCLMNYN
jgi:hypothetical protein